MVGSLPCFMQRMPGARKSILVGKPTGKLELAEKAGVEKTINCDDKDWYEQVIAETGKSVADVELEAVGSTLQTMGSIVDACKICRHSGKIVLRGYRLGPQSDWILGRRLLLQGNNDAEFKGHRKRQPSSTIDGLLPEMPRIQLCPLDIERLTERSRPTYCRRKAERQTTLDTQVSLY